MNTAAEPSPASAKKSRALGGAVLLAIAAACLSFIAAPAGPERDYVGSGLLLAPTNYGLLLPLLGLGAATAELDALLLIETLALFMAGLAVSATLSEGLLLAHQDALSVVVRYPVTNAAMAVLAGVALFAGSRLKGIPLAVSALLAGLAFGMTIGLYSPGDDTAQWFIAPAALAGTGLMLIASFLASKVALGSWWSIARKIFGSWLIATGVLLAGFPLVPKKTPPQEITQPDENAPADPKGPAAVERPAAPISPPGFDPSREP